jgi:DNA polymerase I-like protein with 3'-5' exonuclease and polymerase domains
MIPNPITVDFETEGIVGNPIVNPPKPVGFAVWIPGQEPFYLAFGHPRENNCDWGQAHEYLEKLRDSGQELLFHNDSFDLSVWDKSFCNARWVPKYTNWRRFHDTMYLLFLADPYSPTLSLKPCADRYLGMAPTEADELRDWILSNVPEATSKSWGAFICRAPGSLVGRYAIGDVVRTKKLFDLLYLKIQEAGMVEAYDRERRLFLHMWRGTKRGIALDRDTLEHHEKVYTWCHAESERRLAKTLSCSVEALQHDESFANALESSGAVTEWVLTPKSGKRSMSRDNLKIVIPEVKILMDYHGALGTCLSTFMRPWLEQSAADGRVHPNWNQVRQSRNESNANKSKGTRTGRLSSDSPNFQNVPTEFVTPTGDPLPIPAGLHKLPEMRRYCLPEPGHVWLKRDFSSQEIRILAHFEDGSLCQAYRANPSLDPHQMALEMIQTMIGVTYARREIKITSFSIIYGSGTTGLSVQLGRGYGDALKIKEAYLDAMPGVRTLMRGVQSRGKSGQPIRTWGGRIYYSEPSKEVKGRWMDFAYKLLNYLIQGSAADQTKEALIDWHEHKSWGDVFLATVHDEINISAPAEDWTQRMTLLQECMNRDRFDVPMLSEGFKGPNWADLEECD